MIWGMSSSRTSAWKRCLHTGQCVCWKLRIRMNLLQNQTCSMSVFGACNSWTAWNRSDSSSCLQQSFLTTKRSGQVIVGVLFLHAYAANGLSHGCSFWVIAAWCLSPCVRSFDRVSYYTFFDQLGMDFLFNVYVFWVCVSNVALTILRLDK